MSKTAAAEAAKKRSTKPMAYLQQLMNATRLKPRPLTRADKDLLKLCAVLLAYRKGCKNLNRASVTQQHQRLVLLKQLVTDQFDCHAAGLSDLLSMAGSKVAELQRKLGDDTPLRFQPPVHDPSDRLHGGNTAKAEDSPRRVLPNLGGPNSEWEGQASFAPLPSHPGW